MIWLLVLLIATVTGLLVGTAIWAGRPGSWKGGLAIAVILALVLVPALVFWKYVLFGLVVTSLIAIGIAVALGLVNAARAIARALAVMAILIVLVYLSIQLADPLLFDRESALSLWWKGVTAEITSSGMATSYLVHSENPVIGLAKFGILVVAIVAVASLAIRNRKYR